MSLRGSRGVLARRRPDIRYPGPQGRSRSRRPRLHRSWGWPRTLPGSSQPKAGRNGRNIVTLPFAPTRGLLPRGLCRDEAPVMPSLWRTPAGCQGGDAQRHSRAGQQSRRRCRRRLATPASVRHPGPLHAGDPRGAHGRGGRAVGRDDRSPVGRCGRVRRWSRAARERAQQWHPDRLAPSTASSSAALPISPARRWCRAGVGSGRGPGRGQASSSRY